jgi:hypothetical protein
MLWYCSELSLFNMYACSALLQVPTCVHISGSCTAVWIQVPLLCSPERMHWKPPQDLALSATNGECEHEWSAELLSVQLFQAASACFQLEAALSSQ